MSLRFLHLQLLNILHINQQRTDPPRHATTHPPRITRPPDSFKEPSDLLLCAVHACDRLQPDRTPVKDRRGLFLLRTSDQQRVDAVPDVELPYCNVE